MAMMRRVRGAAWRRERDANCELAPTTIVDSLRWHTLALPTLALRC